MPRTDFFGFTLKFMSAFVRMCLPSSVTGSRPKQMKIFLLTSANKTNPIGHQTPEGIVTGHTFILLVYTVVIDHLFANATAAVTTLT